MFHEYTVQHVHIFLNLWKHFLKTSKAFSTKSSSWSKFGLRNPYIASAKLLFILEKTLFSMFDVVWYGKTW